MGRLEIGASWRPLFGGQDAPISNPCYHYPMSIYVDELRDYRSLMGRGFPGLWCHLVTDGDLQELHDFAARLGISPRRFQNHPRHPHYDLMPNSRALAVVLGAVQVSTRQMALILNERERRMRGESV